MYLCVAFYLLAVCRGQTSAGRYSYHTSVSGVLDIGVQIELVNAALGSDANYTEATQGYEAAVSAGLFLRDILTCDQSQLPACSTEPFSTHASYWPYLDLGRSGTERADNEKCGFGRHAHGSANPGSGQCGDLLEHTAGTDLLG